MAAAQGQAQAVTLPDLARRALDANGGTVEPAKSLSPAAWRGSLNLSQSAAAKLVGIQGVNPARTWQRWESGQDEPPLRVIVEVERLSSGSVTAASWLRSRSAGRDAALNRIHEVRGLAASVARQLGISHQGFQQWRRVPAERTLDVERLTGISRHDLRPDIYPRAEVNARLPWSPPVLTETTGRA